MEKLAQKTALARRFQPGFIELRLDYLQKEPDEREIKKIRSLLKGKEILTIRSKSEGGRYEGSDSERLSLIQRCISELRPKLMDIEASTIMKNSRIMKLAETEGVAVIASSHFFGKTPKAPSLERILSKVPRSEALYAVKIAFSARNFADNLTVLSLYNSPIVKRIKPTKLIAFCMGDLGIFSRIACLTLGSPLSYASLPGKAIAPGQVDFETMRKAVALL